MINQNKVDDLPLIYSCSGCSSAAQMANYLAIQVDRKHEAEMSCIAGVGGGVKPLVAKARSGRKILAIDGCALKCCEHCLNQQGVKLDAHIVLSDYKISKQYHQDFKANEAELLLKETINKIRSLKQQ